MSAKQWGHGYHRGAEAAAKAAGGLVGLWFHSFEDGKIKWQGAVVSQVGGERSYVVQLYEWMIGEPTIQKVVPFDAMTGWQFYPTAYAMRRWWNTHTGGSEADFDWAETVRKQLGESRP